MVLDVPGLQHAVGLGVVVGVNNHGLSSIKGVFLPPRLVAYVYIVWLPNLSLQDGDEREG